MKKSERLTDENSETIRKAKIQLEKKQLQRKRLKTVFTYALVPLVFATGLAVGAVTLNNPSSQESNNKNVQQNVKVEKVEKSLSGKSSEKDKQDAVKSLQETLRLAGKSNGKLDFEKRLTQIDDGDYKDVDKELLNKFYWSDNLEKRKGVKQNVVQGFITMNYVITEKGNKAINPTTKDYENIVYLDQANGRAFVPISIFIGPSNGMSVEMIYDSSSKEWKVDPYSFVEALRLSASLQGQTGQQGSN